MHSFTLGSSAICRACAWGLKIEHCSVFVLSSRCRDESSLIRARRHKTVHSESRALVWGPSSIPPSFWVDNVELFVTVDIHSLLEVVQRLRGERHACLGRQWCVEEASTLPAPNYKTSEWVASLKLYVCLNDASGGVWTLNCGAAHGMTTLAHFLPPLYLSPRASPSAAVWWRLHLLCRRSAIHQGFPKGSQIYLRSMIYRSHSEKKGCMQAAWKFPKCILA